MRIRHVGVWPLAYYTIRTTRKRVLGIPNARGPIAQLGGRRRDSREHRYKSEEGGESEDERERYGIAIRLWPAVATDTSRHRRLIPSQRLRRLALLPDEQMLRMSRTTMHQCHGAAKVTDDQTLTYAVAIGRRDREMQMRIEMLLHASWRRSRLWPTFPRFD